MKKEELIEGIAGGAGLSKAEASRYLDAMLDVLTDALKSGEEVRLTGFGKFSVRERPARQGRNPRTGEQMQIAASRVPGFSAGNALKKALQ